MPQAYADLGESLPSQPTTAVNVDRMMESKEKFERIDTLYLNEAPKTYALWLLTHPYRLARNLFSDRASIFASDFLWLEPARLQFATVARRLQIGSELDPRKETRGFALRRELLLLRPSVMERVPLSARLALILLLPTWGAWRQRIAFWQGLGGFALLVSIAGILNACSGFIADTWAIGEMERHAAIGNMLFNTGTLILLLWAVQDTVHAIHARGSEKCSGVEADLRDPR